MTPAENMVSEGLVPLKEAAAFLGVCKNTVISMVQARELPLVQFREGGKWLIPRKALIQLAASRVHTPF